MIRIRARTLLLVASLALPARTQAQTIAYDASFPNTAHHEAEITLRVSGLPRGQPAVFRMSRSSPGRYALHEFAKNVYDVTAEDGAGRPLTLTRPDPYQWVANGHDGTVRLHYTLFGDRGDGTYAQIDPTHAHLNMPATFMWVVGQDRRPITIRFRVPAGSGWLAATQLFPGPGSLNFTAPDLQYFMDSPTELSRFTLREWTVHSGPDAWPVRLALHHLGTEKQADSFTVLLRQVIDQHIRVFGETPRFDVGSYTFIADYLPWASGDGMEHRNSTILTSASSLASNMIGLLGTASHEFFHCWNVERMRPAGLEPFDFTRANMSDALWFAEGVTSYYGPLDVARTGIQPLKAYAHGLSGGVNAALTAPGRHFFSAAEMSMQAPFVDAATAIDPVNRPNTFISYYAWGAALGLGLDLTLRQRFGHDLDEYMRLLWQRYGRTEIPYTLQDLERALGDLTGDRAFAADFFRRYVRGHEVLDYRTLLGQAGLLVRLQRPGRAFLGPVDLEYETGGARIQTLVTLDSPLYRTGLESGDLVVGLDGRLPGNELEWLSVEAAHQPGDRIRIVWEGRDGRHTAWVVLAQDPRVEVFTFEESGQTVTPAMRQLRDRWLHQH
jgi:predicted metalloprotease with PDZ domain